MFSGSFRFTLCAAAATATAVLMAPTGAIAAGTSGEAPCGTGFNPYDYTRQQVEACGVPTYPLTRVVDLPGGGKNYQYMQPDGYPVELRYPPAGFNPDDASDAQLLEYGYQRRPTGNFASLARWEKAVHAPRAPARDFIAGGVPKAPVVGSAAGQSGYQVVAGNGTFYQSETDWKEPTFYNDSCSNDLSSIWTGIQGNPGPLDQDGVFFNPHGTVPNLANGQAFWQVYYSSTNYPTAYMNLVAQPGNEVDAYTDGVSTNEVWFGIYDYTTNRSATADKVLPGSYRGGIAESLVERNPDPFTGSIDNLTRWDSASLQVNVAMANNNVPLSNWDGATTYPFLAKLNMTQDGTGNTPTLATPGGFTNQYGGFNENWYRCS